MASSEDIDAPELVLDGNVNAMADLKAAARRLHELILAPPRLRLAALEDVSDVIASHAGTPSRELNNGQCGGRLCQLATAAVLM